MSLLNQVLQDLDAREAEDPVKAVLTPVDTAPASNPGDPPGRDVDWERIAVWGSTVLLVAAYLGYMFVYEPALDPEPRFVPAPKVQVVAATDGQSSQTPEPAVASASSGVVDTIQSIETDLDIGTDTEDAPQPPAEVESVTVDLAESATLAGSTGVDSIETTPETALVPEPSTPADPVEPEPLIPAQAAPIKPAPVYTPVDTKPRAERPPEPLVAKRSTAGPPVLAPAAWLAEAKRYWAQGRIASAEERLGMALKYRPQHLAARELLIALLVRGDRLAEAEHQIELGLNHHPQQASLVMLKARLQAQRGEVLTAAATLERSGLAESGEQGVLAMLASLYQQLGNHQDSVAAYRRLVELSPGTGAYWAGLGLGLEAQGESGMALQAYQRALAGPGLPASVADYLRERRNLLE